MAVVAQPMLVAFAPALALLVALALGWFTGERAQAFLRRVRRRHPQAKPQLTQTAPVQLSIAYPAGADATYALAMRPPPATWATHAAAR
jgi:hypothetical protein